MMSASAEPMRQDMRYSPYPFPEPKTPYEAAVDALPPLPRAVFLMHRRDERGYQDIADRLDIDIPTVEACLAEALTMIAAILDGETPTRFDPHGRGAPIMRAERKLRERHRAYCEEGLRARGYSLPVEWREDGDDALAVMTVIVFSLPDTQYAVLRLCQEGLNTRQIARRMWTFERTAYRRLRQVIRQVSGGPAPFDQWLLGDRR